ncbi:MAG: hypothetical protein ACU88J_07465 [Gammaproteobacteria bacterium]
MKKHPHKISRNGNHDRIGLGRYYGSPDYSPYYAYPLVVIAMSEVPSVSILKGVPFKWAPRLLHDKYSQLMPPTEQNRVDSFFVHRYKR